MAYNHFKGGFNSHMAYAKLSKERVTMPKLYVWFQAQDGELVESWENLPGDWNELDEEEQSDECDELVSNFLQKHVQSGFKVVEKHGDR